MYKTVGRGRGAHPGAAAARRRRSTGVDVAICPPFTALGAMVDSARGSRVEVYAQNMHQAPRAPSPARSRRRCSSSSTSHGVVLGHSERRAVLRRDRPRARAEGPRRAARPACTPSLCVGETEEERDDGDTERKLRQQVRRTSPRVADERLARGRDRLRADLGDRHRPGGRRPSRRRRRSRFVRALVARPLRRRRPTHVRVLYGGSVKPDNAAELLALPGRRRRARRRRQPRRRVVRRDRRRRGAAEAARRRCPPGAGSAAGAVRLSDRARRLGDRAAPGPGNAVSLARHARLRRAVGALPAHQLIACGRAVGLPDGQMGNSEVGHLNLGAGAVVLPGPDADRRRDRRRRARRQRGAPRAPSPRRRARAST